jgi:hypothetical protein
MMYGQEARSQMAANNAAYRDRMGAVLGGESGSRTFDPDLDCIAPTDGNPLGQPALLSITERLEKANVMAAQIRERLGRHADRLFGEDYAGTPVVSSGRDQRAGLLGTIEDSLDYLLETLVLADEQAARNCRLA